MQYAAKSVALATGVSLPFAETGDARGVPVVFIHGITDSHLSYQPVLDMLPQGVHAFAVTMRGHGAASKPSTGYSPEDMAADVAAFLDAQKIPRAVIVGHSMGSLVARAFAQAYPKRVLGLVLVGAFASLHDNPAVADLLGALDDLGEDVPYEFAREFQMSTLATPVSKDFLELTITETQKTPTRVFREALASLATGDRTFTGSSLLASVLIVWGDKDVFCVRHDQDALLDAFKGAKLLTYAGVGHAVHWEEPRRFVQDLTVWLMQFEGGAVRAA